MYWNAPHPRRFRLVRDLDITGISGDGHVVDGIEFVDGYVALRWRRPPNSLAIYGSMDDVIAIHGHDGATRVEYLDPPNRPDPDALDASRHGRPPRSGPA
ncbi:hypothetical protein [Streptomyces sp. CBMA29]|uniref:hypothetical protein n=1 Tax=Streptomyces sp. CBMA29 TaxID=1896314 RepID=UPI001661C5D1|nr:hypothetical protein [Streptomyces sp. CBMA29]MBD0734113.1 hypothetical protein [Streptomyces sp. CBMA29]